MPRPADLPPPRPDGSLTEYLDANVAWVEHAAIGVKDDLSPMLAWFDAEGKGGAAIVDLSDKPFAAAMMRGVLRREKAVRYVLIGPAWIVRLEAAESKVGTQIIGEHGTAHPAYRQRRQEVYLVSVGDLREGYRERGQQHLGAILAVERNQLTGRIVALHRQPNDPASKTAGRMANLLGEEDQP